MKTNYFLSVIIPVYNSSKTLKKCLSSVLASNFAKSFEVIVVDDASTDKSPQIAKKFKAKLFINNINRGPAFCRNLGAKKSKAKLLLFLDADVVLKINTIENLVNYYKKSGGSKKSCVCGAYFHQKSINQGFGPQLNALHNFYLFKQTAKLFKQNGALIDNAFPSFCGLIEKKLFKKIGGFNQKYKIAGGEEHDLGFRLQQQKIPIFILLNSPVNHHFKSITNMLIIHFKRGINYLMTEKNYQFKKNCYGISFKEGLNFFLSLTFFLLLIVAIIKPVLIIASLFNLSLHLIIYKHFYFTYLLREKGINFMLKAIITMQFIYLVKALSALIALFLIYIIKKKCYY